MGNWGEQASDTSIACRQIGPIKFTDSLKNAEEVFAQSRSMLFKELHVTRYWDPKRSTLVYVSHTDKLFGGSPKNSTSAVTLMPWPQGTVPTPKMQ